jgi:hypothetical protein
MNLQRLCSTLCRLSPVVCLLLATCGESTLFGVRNNAEEEAKLYPANYKADIIAFLRTYLNDPSNIRDAAAADPSFQQIGREDRYVVCLRFNAKATGGNYAGVKDNLVVFVAGKLDRMVPAQDRCTAPAYQPFPELGRLSR